jgi:hypothetical protein
MMALDPASGKFWIGLNGTWHGSGDPGAGTNQFGTLANIDHLFTAESHCYTTTDINIFNFGQDSSFAGNLTAQGNQDDNEIGDFYYDVPDGFLALCTSNLEDPEIADPTTKFNTVLYTGDGTAIGSGGQAITGVGFSPELIWIKQRSGTEPNNLTDVVRGATTWWESHSYEEDQTNVEMVSTFDSDGFTVGDQSRVNEDTETYVAWNWLAGGIPTTDNVASAGATPTAGSVKINGSNLGSALAGNEPAQKISANTETGFSMVLYDGTAAANTTFAHGLSQAPELIITKNLVQGSDGNANPAVLAPPFSTGTTHERLLLDSNAASYREANYWSDTDPTASVFTVGQANATNKSGSHYMMAYCFHSVEGYSKIGNYEGNGNADGTFIYLGFSPAFFLAKPIDTTGNWLIFDNKRATYNGVSDRQYPNLRSEDGTSTGVIIDFLSNGIKHRTSGDINGASTMMYMAFAENPFKTSNAQ